MARLHIWAAVLVGAGLLAWGVLGQLGVSPSELGDSIEDTTRDFIEGDTAELSESRNITVSGSFDPSELDLSDSPVAELTLRYDMQDKDVTVNDVRISSDDNTRFTVKQFEGTFIIDGRTVSLDGTARSVTVNGVTLDTSTEEVNVKTAGLNTKAINVEDIDIRRFRADSLTGTLNVKERVSVTLEDEPLEMDAFLGDVSVGDELAVVGRARRVFAGGRDYRTVVS